MLTLVVIISPSQDPNRQTPLALFPLQCLEIVFTVPVSEVPFQVSFPAYTLCLNLGVSSLTSPDLLGAVGWVFLSDKKSLVVSAR